MTDYPRYSVFKPFFRKHPDEIRELGELYNSVVGYQNAFKVTPFDFGARIYQAFDAPAIEPVLSPMSRALDALIRAETFIFSLPKPDFANLNVKEQVGMKQFLQKKQYFFANKDYMLKLLGETLDDVFQAIRFSLPRMETPSPFTIPMIYALPNPQLFIEQLYGTLCAQPLVDRGLFEDIRDRMYRNLCEVSDVKPYEPTKKKLKHAEDSDLPLDKLNDVYLKGTPFHDLFLAPVPLEISIGERFNHIHVLGGTGAGKTTLLKNLILFDLQSENPPALVVVDSQGDLIPNISKLEVFDGELRDRLRIITPKDIKHPPALNVFDLNRERLGDYDEMTREQVMAGAIQTFDYLFSGLIGADLTAKQGVFFKYIARLMLSLPDTMGRNATILDMLNLMDSSAPYRDAIDTLPPIQRNFFERDFNNKTFQQTKEQIRYRLQAIIENPTLARLFTSEKTKIDLFTELNQGSIILVDTAKDFLKGSSAHFGRIFISLVLQAVLERAAIPDHQRVPAFLIVDEAAAYFDSNIDDLLTEARKYKLGCLFAHQYLDQATPSLRASLAANTSIKFASGLSMSDARQMAPDMRTTPDFLMAQPRLQFACHIRGVTPQAVSIPIPVGTLEGQPRLDESAYQRLLERNRERVASPALELSTEIPVARADGRFGPRETQAQRRFTGAHKRHDEPAKQERSAKSQAAEAEPKPAPEPVREPKGDQSVGSPAGPEVSDEW